MRSCLVSVRPASTLRLPQRRLRSRSQDSFLTSSALRAHEPLPARSRWTCSAQEHTLRATAWLHRPTLQAAAFALRALRRQNAATSSPGRLRSACRITSKRHWSASTRRARPAHQHQRPARYASTGQQVRATSRHLLTQSSPRPLRPPAPLQKRRHSCRTASVQSGPSLASKATRCPSTSNVC